MCLAPTCGGYSVLTHEAIIDAAWKDNIAPKIPTMMDRSKIVVRRIEATPHSVIQ